MQVCGRYKIEGVRWIFSGRSWSLWQIVGNRNGREKWREMEKEGSWQDNKHATLVIETLSKGMISEGGHPTPSRLPLQTAQHEEFQAKKSSSIRLIIPPLKIATKT